MAVEYTQMGESIPLVGLGVENENLSHFVSSINIEKPEKLNTSFWKPLTTPFFRAQALSFLTKISSLLSQARFLEETEERRGIALIQKRTTTRWIYIGVHTRVCWVPVSKNGPQHASTHHRKEAAISPLR